VNAFVPPRLPLYPSNFSRLGQVTLAVFVALCTSALISLLFSSNPPGSFALDAVLLAACTIQLLAMVFQGQALGRGVSVLQGQRAPAALWRAWLRQWLLSVTRYWALLALAVAVLMATPASHQQWLAAPALLSLLLCVCAPAALARAGLLPRRLGMAMEAGLLALLVAAVASGQMIAALDSFTALPTFILAPCALAWPAAAYWIMRAQADALRSVTGTQTNMLRRMRDAIAGWASRYQPLRMYATDPAAPPVSVSRRTLLAIAVVQNIIFFAQLIPVYWGEQATSIRMARLALVCMTCANALLVRDLHWRALLLPGGTQLRRLGMRIVLSTMSFQAPLVLVAALASVLLRPSPDLGLYSLASIAIPLLELACCTSLMTMLRAQPRQVQTGGLVGLMLLMLYVYVPQWFKLPVPQLTWQVGPAYVLLLASITCIALATANHCWTPKRLLQALPDTGAKQ
jgi:hypothetical protein